jgi:hypothetical protein
MTVIPSDPTGAEAPPEQEDSLAQEINLKRVQLLNLGIIAVAAPAFLLVSRDFALGVLAGGALMAVNLRIIIGVIRSVFLKGGTSVVNVGLYWAKFAGMLFLVGLLVLVVRIDALGFLIGLSTIVVAITAEAFLKMSGR